MDTKKKSSFSGSIGFVLSAAGSAVGSSAPMPPAISTGTSIAPMVPARCRTTILRTPRWAGQHGVWGTTARCSG